MVLSTFLPLNYGLTIGLVTSILINRATEFLHRQKCIYPKNVLVADNEYYYWRYRNFLVSFVHASLTGIGSLYAFSQAPQLMFDVIDTYTEFGYVLTSFSFGYFLYDTLEMFTHSDYKGTTELIFHHILILLCFSNTIVFHKYIGYNMIALCIENSNIFLHFRQLLLLSNYPKAGPYYQMNCLINIAMFILIRGSCMFWLWYTLLINLSVIPWITKAIALTAMSGISVTTVILFKRVFKSDFVYENGSISRRKASPKATCGSAEDSTKTGGSNPSSEPDLYEPMEDTYHQDQHQEILESSKSSNNGSNTNGLRKRLNGVALADNVAAATTAAVNN